MINPRKSAVWSSTKRIAPFSCTSRVQEVHTKPEVVHLTPGFLGLGVLFNYHHRKCIAKQMNNPRISADWSSTKSIAPFTGKKIKFPEEIIIGHAKDTYLMNFLFQNCIGQVIFPCKFSFVQDSIACLLPFLPQESPYSPAAIVLCRN